MYLSCLDSLKLAKETIQNIENFIYWLEEDAVYVVDEKDSWTLVTFDHLDSRYFNRIDNVDIPELPDYFQVQILSREHRDKGGGSMVLHHTDQWRMRKVPKEEWPMFMDNASDHFEWMLKNGRHISPEKFLKLQSGE